MNKEESIRKSQKYWIIVFVVVVVILLGAGLYLSLKNSDQEDNNTISNNSLVNQTSDNSAKDVFLEKYENSDYGFSIEYPADWQSETSSSGSGSSEIFSIGLSKNGQEVGLSVMSDEMEGLVRNSISVSKESILDIDGVMATKLEGGNVKDGSLVNLVIIKNKGRLYSFRGLGSDFDQIVSSFKLL